MDTLKLSESPENLKKPYKSLYDNLDKKTVSSCTTLGYAGTLSDVLDRTSSAMIMSKTFLDSQLSLELILDMPRILRGLMDYKIENRESGVEKYILDAVDTSLAVYSRSEGAYRKFLKLKYRLLKAFEYTLAHQDICQQDDSVSWHASSSVRSAASVRLLTEDKELGDILFIPLGHGAVSAGLDIYLRYIDITGNKNSVFYPIRFSKDKKGDVLPRTSELELEYLKKQARGRNIVVFDEDSSGRTLGQACTFFDRHVLNSRANKYLLGLTNANRHMMSEKSELDNPPAIFPRRIKNKYGTGGDYEITSEDFSKNLDLDST